MSDGTHLTATVRERAAQAVIDGMGILTVATAYGVDRKTVSRWVSKFSGSGRAALHRKAGSGRPRKLDELTEDELSTIVLKGAIAFCFETDLWTVSRLRRVIQDEFRIQLSKNTIWRRLRDAGLTYQKPEREYYEIDEAARKKWIRYEVPKIQRAVQKHRAILYFQDESNISLTAFLGKTWAPCGQTPKVIAGLTTRSCVRQISKKTNPKSRGSAITGWNSYTRNLSKSVMSKLAAEIGVEATGATKTAVHSKTPRTYAWHIL